MANEEQVEKPAEAPAATETTGKVRRKLDPRVQMILDHVWGPTGSVIMHIILVIILFNLVMSPRSNDLKEIQAQIIEAKEAKLEEPEKIIEEPEEIKPEEIDFSQPMEQPQEVSTVTSDPQSEDLAELDIRTDVMGPLVMKDLFAGRSADGRAKAAGAYNPGAGGATEIAVMKALRWLKDHQQSEGYWGTGEGNGGHREAMTGIALLAFLAHGETPASKEFGATVEKAIRWLKERQGPDGYFLRMSDHPAAYANGIAVYALAEAYALTRIPELRGVVEKGVSKIIEGQQDTGGFTYEYAKDGRRDTSLSGWQAQAMKASYISGVEVSSLKDAMEKAVSGFKMNYQSSSGKFMYAPQGGNNSHVNFVCTGIGVLSLQLLGHPKDPEVDGGIKALSTVRVAWDEKAADIGDWTLYGWYYITQAKFHRSDSEWATWRGQYYKVMLEKQNQDGSWTPFSGGEKNHGRVYGTAFTALSLMVYYRYLPTYKQIGAGGGDAPAAPQEQKSDDVVVEIGAL